MKLAHARNDCLAGLFVGEDTEGWIFLRKSRECRRGPGMNGSGVFVSAPLSSNGGNILIRSDASDIGGNAIQLNANIDTSSPPNLAYGENGSKSIELLR